MGFFSRFLGGRQNDGPEPTNGPEPSNPNSKEASKMARLLVSELALYNEEVLESARRRGNVYAALKADIDRIRKMYDEGVDRQKVDRDYLYLEMVSRLAGGRSELLGVPPGEER